MAIDGDTRSEWGVDVDSKDDCEFIAEARVWLPWALGMLKEARSIRELRLPPDDVDLLNWDDALARGPVDGGDADE